MRVLPFAAVSSLALFAVGCGGGSGLTGSGNPKITIKWPDTTRNFTGTPFSKSARITLTEIDNPSRTQTWVVTRPAGSGEVSQTYTAPGRNVNGDCYLYAEFVTASDGSGPMFAFINTAAEVQPDGTLAKDGGSPLDELYIAQEPFAEIEVGNDVIEVGSEQPLLANGVERVGGIGSELPDVLHTIPSGAATFTVIGDSATITNGKLRGVKQGSVFIETRFKRNQDGQEITDRRQVAVVPSSVTPRVYANSQARSLAYALQGNSSFNSPFGLRQNTSDPYSSFLVRIDSVNGQTSDVLSEPVYGYGLCNDGINAWVGDIVAAEGTGQIRFRKINLTTLQVSATALAEGFQYPRLIVVNPQNDNEFFASCSTGQPMDQGKLVRYRNGEVSTSSAFVASGLAYVGNAKVWATEYPFATGLGNVIRRIDLSQASSSFDTQTNHITTRLQAGDMDVAGNKVFTDRFEVFDVQGETKLNNYGEVSEPSGRPFGGRLVATDPAAGIVWFATNPTGPMRRDTKLGGSRFIVVRAVRASDMTEIGSATLRLPKATSIFGMTKFGAKGLAFACEDSFAFLDSAPGL